MKEHHACMLLRHDAAGGAVFMEAIPVPEP